jgi:hypothetical protein
MVQKKATDFQIQPRIGHGCFIDGHKSPPERKEKGPKIAPRPYWVMMKAGHIATRNFRL